ncbi:NAD-dependent protein deacetylase [Halioxenophilus aromaticivorans]|uniref:protein acetyllysine N-acetyltransferase n=1 Tax=Halioxenophilus aromaticivorans TaxID=1306992 RepID=A0AAV3U299_9ALTE
MKELALLTEFIGQHRRLLIITGAGCSTSSGIPAYRDRLGNWLARKPIQHQEFLNQEATRKRYWARSMLGWPNMRDAQPNGLHNTLPAWEQAGRVELLITQNVDGLHRRAGSNKLVELHGRVGRVTCLQCSSFGDRNAVQQRLEALNGELLARIAQADVDFRPDGDAEFGGIDYSGLVCPPCAHCGGTLMPDVVFFGGSVPKQRVERCNMAVACADAVLVLGSSLMVYSSFRFCRLARELNKPIAIINQGVTRADDMADLKLELECVAAVEAMRPWITEPLA